jgi:cytidylate kinase
MAVVTISREIYSEGSYIGEKVADGLGYHFVSKNGIEKIFLEHGLVEFGKVYESIEGFWTRFDDMRSTTIEFLKQVILALANHGNVVIVGRGAFAVLGAFADVLNVRVQAPLPFRVKRAMEKEKITESHEAEVFLKKRDRERDAFVESFYNIRWVDAAPKAFDMVINTGKVPPDMATAWVVKALRDLKKRKKDAELTTKTIKVDPELAGTVSQVLGCYDTH